MRKFTIGLMVVFIIILSTYSFLTYKIGDYGLETDFFWNYAPAAMDLQQGEVNIYYYRHQPPLYATILSVFAVFWDVFTAGKILALLITAVTLIFAYKLFSSIFSARFVLWGMLFLMCNANFVNYGYRVGVDGMFAMWSVMLFYYTYHRRLIPMILIAAAAALTRTNGIVFPVFVVGWAAWTNRDHWTKVIHVIATLSVPLLAWGSFFYHEGGSFITLFHLNRPDELPTVGLFGPRILEHFTGDMNNLIGWSLAALVMYGIYCFSGSAAKESRHNHIVISALLMFGFLLFPISSERYSLCLLPIYLLFMIVGLKILRFQIFIKIRNKSLKYSSSYSHWWWRHYLANIIIVLVFITWFPGQIMKLHNIAEMRVDYLLPAVEQLKVLPPGRMAAIKPHVPFLIGQEYVPLLTEAENIDSLIVWLKAEDIDYLYLSRGETGFRLGLKDMFLKTLLNDRNFCPELLPLTYIPDIGGLKGERNWLVVWGKLWGEE